MQAHLKELTVSMVTYKSELKQVSRSVSDILRGYSSVFIVIVDNNSGEDYLTSLKSSFQHEKKVLVVSSGVNKGYGFGHNFAIKKCPPSRLHLVMNTDIEIEETSLKNIINFIGGREDIGLALPKILNPDGSLQALNKRHPTLLDMFLRFFAQPSDKFKFIKKRLDYYEMHDFGYEREVDVPYGSGCFMLFKRAAFHRVNGFDENFFMYLEDADITRRIAEFSRSVYYPDAKIVHHWTRGSYRNLKLFFITLYSMKVYFSKWGWALS